MTARSHVHFDSMLLGALDSKPPSARGSILPAALDSMPQLPAAFDYMLPVHRVWSGLTPDVAVRFPVWNHRTGSYYRSSLGKLTIDRQSTGYLAQTCDRNAIIQPEGEFWRGAEPLVDEIRGPHGAQDTVLLVSASGVTNVFTDFSIP